MDEAKLLNTVGACTQLPLATHRTYVHAKISSNIRGGALFAASFFSFFGLRSDEQQLVAALLAVDRLHDAVDRRRDVVHRRERAVVFHLRAAARVKAADGHENAQLQQVIMSRDINKQWHARPPLLQTTACPCPHVVGFIENMEKGEFGGVVPDKARRARKPRPAGRGEGGDKWRRGRVVGRYAP